MADVVRAVSLSSTCVRAAFVTRILMICCIGAAHLTTASTAHRSVARYVPAPVVGDTPVSTQHYRRRGRFVQPDRRIAHHEQRESGLTFRSRREQWLATALWSR